MMLKKRNFITAALFSTVWYGLADGSDEVKHVRRVDQQDIDCIPLLRVTQYDHDSFHPGPHTEWNCQLLSSTPAAMGRSGKIVKLKNLYNLPEGTVQKFESGSSVLSISGAQVTAVGIQISKGAGAAVLKTKIDTRKLQTGNIKKKVLVIRVKTQAGATTASADTLSDKVFGTSGDPVNLSSQYDDCSYGKLTFSALDRLNTGDPALDAPGIYEVVVSTTTKDHERLREMITDKLNDDWPNTPLPNNSWGDLDEATRFDHIMYCMPPNTDMGIAYAFVNSWLSVYKDKWCLYPSAQIHEIGHNIGLDHSWEGTREYHDQSGMMGFSYASDDHPKMCFNAAKSFQLGWYSDKTTTVNPLIDPTWSGRLVGIANYDDAGNDQVLVKIETGSSLDYYMNFNRQTGINSETQEGGNQVLITTQGREGVSFAKSTMVAKLSEGGSFVIKEFGGVSNDPVRITVNKIDASSFPGYADVTVSGSSEPTSSIFLNCGGNTYNDGSIVWNADGGYVNTGAKSYTTGATIEGVPVARQDIYKSERYDPNLSYRVPLPTGNYDVYLHLTEIYVKAAGSRVFDVIMEGMVKFSNVDVFKEAGNKANKGFVKVAKKVHVRDGALNINFISKVQLPKINAIEIHPSGFGPSPTPSPPTLRPTVPPTPRPTLRPTMPPTPAPTPTSSPLQVTAFALVNAATNQDIEDAFDCSPYVCTNGATSFNIRADTTAAVKSVRFSISGPLTLKPRIENVKPFSAFGDIGGNYDKQQFPAGRYKVIAEPFSDSDATGTAGPITTLEFEVADTSSEGTWEAITFDDFEAGWGSFERIRKQGGRPDADRITASQQQSYIHQGSAALRIRDGSETTADSSVFQAQNHDVTSYSDLKVSFWFYPRSMPGTDGFLVEYSSNGGSSWSTIKTFQNGRDFANGQFYNEVVVLSKSELKPADIKLTSQARIRFRCAASSNTDLVYIDEVSFEGRKK